MHKLEGPLIPEAEAAEGKVAMALLAFGQSGGAGAPALEVPAAPSETGLLVEQVLVVLQAARGQLAKQVRGTGGRAKGVECGSRQEGGRVQQGGWSCQAGPTSATQGAA